MRLRAPRLLVVLAAAALAAGSAAIAMADQGRAPAASDRPHVVLVTALGEIELELYADRAPITVANFLRYVDADRYRDGRFHRTVRAHNQPDDPYRIDVIQAGVAPRWATRDFPPIPLERTGDTGLHHRDGTVSMARAGPDSATSDFFICIGPQPELDEGGRRNLDRQGFAAFGRVVRGMDVVRRIHDAPAQGQRLDPPIRIVSARRLGAAAR